MKYRATYGGPAIQKGTASVPVSAAVNGNIAVVFDTPFAAAPVVVATAENSFYNAAAGSITTTGCDIAVRQINAASATATITVHWIAVL